MRDRGMPGFQIRWHLTRCRAAERVGPIGWINRRLSLAGNNLNTADRDGVAGNKDAVGGEQLPTHNRAVAAVEIPDRPARGCARDLGMKPAGLLVVDHHAIGGRTAERHALSQHERDHRLAGDGIANKEKSDGRRRHAGILVSPHHDAADTLLGGRGRRPRAVQAGPEPVGRVGSHEKPVFARQKRVCRNRPSATSILSRAIVPAGSPEGDRAQPARSLTGGPIRFLSRTTRSP